MKGEKQAGGWRGSTENMIRNLIESLALGGEGGGGGLAPKHKGEKLKGFLISDQLQLQQPKPGLKRLQAH